MEQDTKWCGAGKHELHVSEFWKRGNKLQPNCKTCQSKINKARYKNDPTQHIHNVVANNRRRMKILQEWKQTLSCRCCGESYYLCLDFHHLNPKNKDFSIGDAFWKFGIKRVSEELRKCVVLCANCHRKVHGGVLVVTEEHCCDPSELETMSGV